MQAMGTIEGVKRGILAGGTALGLLPEHAVERRSCARGARRGARPSSVAVRGAASRDRTRRAALAGGRRPDRRLRRPPQREPLLTAAAHRR